MVDPYLSGDFKHLERNLLTESNISSSSSLNPSKPLRSSSVDHSTLAMESGRYQQVLVQL